LVTVTSCEFYGHFFPKLENFPFVNFSRGREKTG